jgi:hypothetical protein
MEVPIFSKWWEIALFVLLGLLFLPFFLFWFLVEALHTEIKDKEDI